MSQQCTRSQRKPNAETVMAGIMVDGLSPEDLRYFLVSLSNSVDRSAAAYRASDLVILPGMQSTVSMETGRRPASAKRPYSRGF